MIKTRGIIFLAIVVSLFGIGVWYGVALFTAPTIPAPVTTETHFPTEVTVITIPTTCEPITEPGVFINPIDNIPNGTPTLRVSGVTSAEVGSAVSVYVLCDNYHLTPAAARSDNPTPYDRYVVSRVFGSGYGLHKWSVDVDTAGLRPGLYIVYVGVSGMNVEYTRRAEFYVIDSAN